MPVVQPFSPRLSLELLVRFALVGLAPPGRVVPKLEAGVEVVALVALVVGLVDFLVVVLGFLFWVHLGA